ncbi:MAG: IS1380 family transposase [bacterium]|nr:IS1380 family transposase [bacterium]
MAQKVLSYEYEVKEEKTGLTALGGLPTYLDLAAARGLLKSIDRNLNVGGRCQGWTDRQIVMSLILINLAGGDCVDDIEKLEGDEGFCQILRKVETHGLKRKEKVEMKKRWRKGRERTLPSASVIFRYLSNFHNEETEKKREEGKAYIPGSNEHMKALARINSELIGYEKGKGIQETATLDMDATITATNKELALYSYKGEKSYQPINTHWYERGVMLHTEFRDGNVPAGYEQLRVFKEALGYLPEGVKKVRLRSDTAGYQHELLRYCNSGRNERFGKIEFAIGCDVTREFRKAVMKLGEQDWKPLYREIKGEKEETGRQWAEVCFVPNKICSVGKDQKYRYIATREELKQKELPGIEKGEGEYPFPVMGIRGQRYKVFGIVTNMQWSGEKLVPWLYKRCGKSEEAHAVMKNDLAGGRFPSGDFGENAAWWWIMILSYNLNMLMKTLVLGKPWINKRMKAIRFGIINIAARVMSRSRCLYVRISGHHPSSGLLIEIRQRIAQLAAGFG